MFWFKRKVSPLADEIRSLKGMIKTLEGSIEDMQEALEKFLEKTEKKNSFLEHQLNTKSSFIEKLLERAMLNGHDKHEKEVPNGKGGEMVDISLLDTATQNIVRNKVKNLGATVKKLP